MRRNIYLGAGILALGLVLGTTEMLRKPSVVHAVGTMAPRFEVDPYWPKPLPHHWVTGSTIGVATDAQDNVWTIHRPQTVEKNFAAVDQKVGECCKIAPPVLEYDQAGNVINSWGGPGPGYDWPDSNHGITVDHHNNVWIGGNGKNDTQILKFTTAGQFIMQLGKHGVHHGSNDPDNFWQPTKMFDDVSTNEMYISDGYGNHRVIVVDEDTGKFKRLWGAYGNKPTDEKETSANPAGDEDAAPGKPNPDALKNFRTPHCVIVSNDGLVYVCDRVNDRIQVFHKDGTFVKEVFIEPATKRSGSVWDMTFSRDPQQTYIYVANGVNEHINVLQRSSLEVLTSFGDGGREAGAFYGCHNVVTDSKGNLYVTETYSGARIQRFLYKGVGPVEKVQSVPWPKGKL